MYPTVSMTVSFPNKTNNVVADDIEAHIPQAVAVLDRHESWRSNFSNTSSVSAASRVSEYMLFGIGKTMAKKAKARVESGEWPGNFAVCFMFTFGLVALGVLLPIVGVISALTGRAFMEQQVLDAPFPDGVGFDLGYVTGLFVFMGLAYCGVFVPCITLAITAWKLIENNEVPRTLNLLLVPVCMLSVVGMVVLPALVVAKTIADTFSVRLEGVFIFLLVANVIELLKGVRLSNYNDSDSSSSSDTLKSFTICTYNNDSDSDNDDDDDENEECESFIFGCAWRALGSFVAYIAATNGGHLPAIVNGQGLAAVLGAVGGTFLVPVFMVFQLQAQEILSQDNGNSTVPFFT